MSVIFSSGQVFPIRYYLTTDVYSVDLPAGTFEAERLVDLARILKSEFDDVRVVRHA